MTDCKLQCAGNAPGLEQDSSVLRTKYYFDMPALRNWSIEDLQA